MKALKCLAAAVLGCAALVSGPASAQNAPARPLEFNYGIPMADHVTVFVAQDLNLFEKVGLKPNFFFFQSGAPLLAGLKSESLDVVTAGLALTFALGQDIPLKFLFWEANNAAAEGLVVDPKSEIKSYKEIGKARKIGAASGTCAQVSLYLMAQKVGLDYTKLNVVSIPAPLFRNSFLSGSIDAGIAWAPYSVTLDSEGYRVVNWDPDYVPQGGLCPRMTGIRPGFLKAHPEIGRKLLEVDAMASAAVAANPQLGVDAIAKRLGLAEPVARATFERLYRQRPGYEQQVDPASPYSLTAKDGGLARNLSLSLQALQETKSIPAPVPLSAIQEAIDPSHLQAILASRPGK